MNRTLLLGTALAAGIALGTPVYAQGQGQGASGGQFGGANSQRFLNEGAGTGQGGYGMQGGQQSSMDEGGHSMQGNMGRGVYGSQSFNQSGMGQGGYGMQTGGGYGNQSGMGQGGYGNQGGGYGTQGNMGQGGMSQGGYGQFAGYAAVDQQPDVAPIPPMPQRGGGGQQGSGSSQQSGGGQQGGMGQQSGGGR